ncbi:hypothetical protein [Gaiella sp.]|uniref:hypothetical protein n=1 Tax=Gaiella sp. TaxID=2663207 RepID=UPI0039838FA4
MGSRLGVAVVVMALAATALVTGCEGGKDTESVSEVPCDDAAFRGQDEELYVAQATIANATGGGGDPATLLLDLRRGRAALAGYVEKHPPCDSALQEIAASETEAVVAIDKAIAAIEDRSDPAASLRRALKLLESAQADLAQSP